MYEIIIGFNVAAKERQSAVFPGVDFDFPDNIKSLRRYQIDKKSLAELTAIPVKQFFTGDDEACFQILVIYALLTNSVVSSVTIHATNAMVAYSGDRRITRRAETFSRHLTRKHQYVVNI